MYLYFSIILHLYNLSCCLSLEVEDCGSILLFLKKKQRNITLLKDPFQIQIRYSGFWTLCALTQNLNTFFYHLERTYLNSFLIKRRTLNWKKWQPRYNVQGHMKNWSPQTSQCNLLAIIIFKGITLHWDYYFYHFSFKLNSRCIIPTRS